MQIRRRVGALFAASLAATAATVLGVASDSAPLANSHVRHARPPHDNRGPAPAGVPQVQMTSAQMTPPHSQRSVGGSTRPPPSSPGSGRAG